MPIAAVPGGGTPSYTFENHGYLLFYRNASYPAGAGLATLASIGGTKPATASRTTRALTQRPCICTECLDTMLRPQGISECVGRNSRYHFMIGNVFRTMIPGTNPRLEEIGARMRRHLPFGVRPYARSRIASRYGTQGNGYTLGNSTWPQASGRAGSRVLGLGRGGPGRPPALAQEGHRAKDLAGAGRDERGRRPPFRHWETPAGPDSTSAPASHGRRHEGTRAAAPLGRFWRCLLDWRGAEVGNRAKTAEEQGGGTRRPMSASR